MEDLRNELINIVNSIKGNKGIFIKDMSTNKYIGIDANRRFNSASIIKIPVMYDALLQVQNGKLKLDDMFLLDDDEKVGGSGILHLLHNKIELSLEDIIALMIDVSDNTATNMLYDILGKDSINSSIKELGLKNTLFARKLMRVIPGLYSYTTANDIGILLEEFMNCKFLSQRMANKGMEIMYNQQYNDRLSGRLIECGSCGEYLGNANTCRNCGTVTTDVDPILVAFAHKTGSINATVHDAGILTVNDKKIIIVCLTDSLENDVDGGNMQKEIGLAVYKYFK